MIGVQLVNRDVAGHTAVAVLRAADVNVDVGVVVRAVDAAPRALEAAVRRRCLGVLPFVDADGASGNGELAVRVGNGHGGLLFLIG
jgi:hypothetical protein